MTLNFSNMILINNCFRHGDFHFKFKIHTSERLQNLKSSWKWFPCRWISVYWSVTTSLPSTASRSIDAMTTSMLSSSEKSEHDIVSMLVWSLCSSLCSSLVCMSSMRRRIDLKSAIIVCVSNSVQVILCTVMRWCEVVNLCRVSPSIATTSASNTHLSYLQYNHTSHSSTIQ